MNLQDSVARVAGSTWLRWMAAACIVAIAVLSLIPKNVGGVDDSAIHGSAQHFIAYLATALVIGLATRTRRNPIVLILALAALAGVMEILQTFSPGRSPELQGFVTSSVGAAAGAMIAFTIRPP